MRRVMLVFVLVLVPSLGSAQVQIPDEVVRQQLWSLISTHPDAMLRADMIRWAEQGRYKIQPATEVKSLAWGTLQDGVNPKLQWPVLLVNPIFFRTTFVSPAKRARPQAVEMEKYGALYHEYVHLINHINGKYPITTSVATLTAEQSARFFWGAELEAHWGEYQFLKRRGYPEIFFQTEEFSKYPEWEAFLRNLHDRLMSGVKDAPKYKAYWDRYLRDALKSPR